MRSLSQYVRKVSRIFTSFQLFARKENERLYLRGRCIRILNVEYSSIKWDENELFLEYSWILCIDYSRDYSISRDADALLSNYFEISLDRKFRLFSVYVCVCGMHTYMQLAKAST